jgi:uncharacterized protein
MNTINIKRSIMTELLISAASYPVVTIIGPRQSGKTTLSKSTFPQKIYVNLEDPDIRCFATEDPRAFLAGYPDGAIIDEIQRVPELLSYIQGIVDAQEDLGLFILTGSHQLLLQKEISQSLAGRTGILHLMPFSMHELQQAGLEQSLDQQLFYGFYPRIYKDRIEPQRFYRDYVQTYIERDLKLMIKLKDLDQFQRFLSLCATRLGQTIDYTHFANALGMSRHTIKEWLSLLKASFIITTLPPYFKNFGKRIVKSSKLYFNDVGLVCYLLGIRTQEQVVHHPLRGPLFENLVINEVMKTQYNYGQETSLYFYRDSQQSEVDLLFQKGLELIAMEIKSSQTFHPSFLKGLAKLKSLIKGSPLKGYLIYSGEHEQKVHHYQVLNYKHINNVINNPNESTDPCTL